MFFRWRGSCKTAGTDLLEYPGAPAAKSQTRTQLEPRHFPEVAQQNNDRKALLKAEIPAPVDRRDASCSNTVPAAGVSVAPLSGQ
jgi:hypothetical protein